MASGGYRPTAPQNNFGVSATGGAGNKGTQAPRYMRDLPQGQGRATFNNSKAAPLAGDTTPVPNAVTNPTSSLKAMQAPQVIPLTAPTQQPNVPVTDGAATGDGRGLSAIGMNQAMINNAGGVTAKQTVQSLAMHPDASPELKSLASYLEV